MGLEKARIVQISKYYYPFFGGTEQIAKDISGILAEAEAAQEVLCFNEDARAGGMETRRGETVHDQVDGVDVIRCGCQTKIFSQSLSWSYRSELTRMFRDFRPDTVVLHYPNPFAAHHLLRCLPDRCRLIVWWHLDIVKQKILRKLFVGQDLRLIQRADAIVATSPPYIEGSPRLRRAREKCRVIPNCIDVGRLRLTPEVRKEAERIRAEAGDKILCVAVGRHTKYKGMRELIRASRYLDDRFQICLIGKGEETESLRREVEGDGKIRFLGAVSDTVLRAYLTAMDLFCFPSITKNEAFGLALAEAMWCGKPAVTFTIPGSGVNYVCPDGEAGIEVPNGDVRAYADAMKVLADDPALRERLGENGRKRVETHFLYDQFRENVLDLFDGL